MTRNQEHDWNSVKEEIIDDVLLALNQEAYYSDNTQCDDPEYDITFEPDGFSEVVKEEQIDDEIEAPEPLSELNVKDEPSDVISGDVKEELMDHGIEGPPESGVEVQLNDGTFTSKSEYLDVGETLEGTSSNYNLRVAHKKWVVCDVCGHFTYQGALMKLHMMKHMLVGRTKKKKKTRIKFPKNNGMLNSSTIEIPKSGNNMQIKPGFICHICEHRTNQKRLLKRHIRAHLHEKQFACKVCDYRSVKKAHLKDHMMIHADKKPFACGLCGYRYACKAYLNNHMMIHTGEKPFACELCAYRSTCKSYLKKHVMIHTGEKPFACEICDYRGTCKAYLKKHMRIHTGEKPYACDLCDYCTVTKSCLKRHVMTHTGEKPYACDICDHRTSNKSLLRRHLKIHSGEKSFACKRCDYHGVTSSYLNKHMRVHIDENEKQFGCYLHDYRGLNKSNLKQQLQRHTSERGFVCNLCNHRSEKKYLLEEYMMIHKDEKPFGCNFCSYRSTHQVHVTAHMKYCLAGQPMTFDPPSDHPYCAKDNRHVGKCSDKKLVTPGPHLAVDLKQKKKKNNIKLNVGRKIECSNMCCKAAPETSEDTTSFMALNSDHDYCDNKYLLA